MDQTILLFTGHLLDNVDRVSARFPYRLIREVDRIIQAELDVFPEDRLPLIAISSLAAGGDMIFAEEVLKRKIPLDVFLPFEEDKFLSTSVKYLKDHPDEDGGEWERQYHKIIAAANSVTISKGTEVKGDVYSACNKAMLDYALQRANYRPDRVMALALVQPNSEVIPGGSTEFVKIIEASGIRARKIWPVRSNRLFK